MLQATIKGGLQKGLGALGKLFGVDVGKGKPDFTAGNPGHVVVDRTAFSNSIPGIFGGTGGGGKKLGGIFGSGDQGGGVFSFLSKLLGGGGGGGGIGSMDLSMATGLAEGGPVIPGAAYMVGEHGPERFTSGTPGQISSNAASRRMLSGGGDNHFYSIDARGTDPVLTEMRVKAAINAARTSAITTSVLAQHDQIRRMPATARP
jgi:hypothetical protein